MAHLFYYILLLIPIRSISTPNGIRKSKPIKILLLILIKINFTALDLSNFDCNGVELGKLIFPYYFYLRSNLEDLRKDSFTNS